MHGEVDRHVSGARFGSSSDWRCAVDRTRKKILKKVQGGEIWRPKRERKREKDPRGREWRPGRKRKRERDRLRDDDGRKKLRKPYVFFN